VWESPASLTHESGCAIKCEPSCKSSLVVGASASVDAIKTRALDAKLATTRICHICSAIFKDDETRLRHMQRVHKTVDMPYVCRLCQFETSLHDDLVFHFAQVHERTFLHDSKVENGNMKYCARLQANACFCALCVCTCRRASGRRRWRPTSGSM